MELTIQKSGKVIVKGSWIVLNAILLFNMTEIWGKDNNKKKPQKTFLYRKYLAPSAHSLNLHLHVSQ